MKRVLLTAVFSLLLGAAATVAHAQGVGTPTGGEDVQWGENRRPGGGPVSGILGEVLDQATDPKLPGPRFCVLRFYCERDGIFGFYYNLANFVFGFIGLILVVIVLYGGFLYLTSAGDEAQGSKGKKAIAAAAAGFVLLMLAYGAVTVFTKVTKGNQTVQT